MTAGLPNYAGSTATAKIEELLSKRDESLLETKYVNVPATARLIATVLGSYRASLGDAAWRTNVHLRALASNGHRLHLVLAAIFDLITNVEYCHGRLTNTNWIYCDAEPDGPRVYYSFLKQCPRCCWKTGRLEKRLEGAQHKPSSHHIGEITTTTSALLLRLILTSGGSPLTVASVTDQRHDVDVMAYAPDSLILFEIKASPMVTYPVVRKLPHALLDEGSDGERVTVSRHALVTNIGSDDTLGLFMPHYDITIPLGSSSDKEWPYPRVTEWCSVPANFMRWFSAWLELYDAYRIPKVERTGDAVRLAYLVNGWGDEIDSNKTKPGLGRTDDIKKGTYQLLKYGAQYRDDSLALKVRGALLANLDPLFLRADYLDDLVGIRWGHGHHFQTMNGGYYIADRHLRHLYDGILAFNEPVLNDPFVKSAFDIQRTDAALVAGELDALLARWASGTP